MKWLPGWALALSRPQLDPAKCSQNRVCTIGIACRHDSPIGPDEHGLLLNHVKAHYIRKHMTRLSHARLIMTRFDRVSSTQGRLSQSSISARAMLARGGMFGKSSLANH
ncbi:MAG: hypothetical protein ACI8XD_000612 [Thermoproteota archaeon]|jgi:hypothetical protein